MNGPSKIGLILLITILGGVLNAQFLPDIDQFEVENSRLILLDENGQRKGVLKGELARKQRDGRIYIENAELTIEREVDSFVLKAEEFTYEPDTHNFECNKGLTADLPDGGKLTVPKGSGQIFYADAVILTMTCTGEATLISGRKGSEVINAKIADPIIDLKLVSPPTEITASDDEEKPAEEKKSSRLVIDHVTISGLRGGELELRLAHLPDVGDVDPKKKHKGAVVKVSCFGDVSVSVKDEGRSAEVKMLRRARMELDSEERKFELSSNRLNISGTIVQQKEDDKDKTEPKPDQKFKASLTDMAIDAMQNVQLKGEDFEGASSVLSYREFGERREVRLSGDPSMTRHQKPNSSGQLPRIELRAREYIDVFVPASNSASTPEQISTELSENSTVQRFLDDVVEWQINGRLVRLFSTLDASATQGSQYNHTFDAFAKGYSPLLRVTGLQPEDSSAPDIQRAAVYGSRATGSFITGRAKVKVFGPEILGVVYTDAPVSDLMRIALGLKAQTRDKDGKVVPPPRSDSRLTVRAKRFLNVDMLTSGDSGDLSIAAEGEVQLDHEPLPRDDTNLVSLTGQYVALSLKDRLVRFAQLEGTPGSDALATMGYDILITRSVSIREDGNDLLTRVSGPGRIVVRNKQSVDYFKKELGRLPKRPASGDAPTEPDAAWFEFGQSFVTRVGNLQRTIEAEDPYFRLVFGDFLKPRAGRTAIKDLDELTEPEVIKLYEAQARRLFASTKRAGPKTPGVNLLMLEGDAVVNSRIDGITASAVDAIELSGSDNRSSADAPLSVVLRRDAVIEIDDAGLFFGEYVRYGVFSYDGTWRLESAVRLEITFRPLEAPDGKSELIPQVRKHLGNALQAQRTMLSRLHEIEQANTLLQQIAATKRPTRPGTDQPWKAALESARAIKLMRSAMHMYIAGFQSHTIKLAAAMRHSRRCRALISALVDVAGSGTVGGHFRSSRETVPPLDLTMREALFTFDGLGQVIDVTAKGPIDLSRDAYTLSGTRLHRHRNGTLTLDNASITLPDDTGVKVEGVTSISLTHQESRTFGTQTTRTRTMVTRVSGKQLKVSVKLTGAGKK